MRWSLRVLTGLTDDSEPSIILNFEQPPSKYIFNIGEGTTRAAVQRKYAIAKTKAIFFTRMHPEQIGGYPGVLMTLADSGTRDLTVCGPPGLLHYIASTRFYARRTQLGMTLEECATSTTPEGPITPIFKDDNISVYPILLGPSVSQSPESPSDGSTSSKRKRSESPSSPSPAPKRPNYSSSRSRSTSPPLTGLTDDPFSHDFRPRSLTGEAAIAWRRGITKTMFRPEGVTPPPNNSAPGHSEYTVVDVDPPADSESDPLQQWKLHFRKSLPSFSPPSVQALSYVIVGPSARGKFDANKAKALGVNGPLRGKLTKGETVISPSGAVVTPEMCVGPPSPPPAVVFVHVPDPSYIESLFTATSDGKFAPPTYAPEAFIHVVVHRVGEGVMEDPRYRSWMAATFEPRVHHLVASPRHSPNPLVFSSTANIQTQLTSLDSEIFRTPHHANAPLETLSFSDLPPNTTPLIQDTEVQLQPPTAPCLSPFAPKDDLSELVATLKSGSYVSPLADAYKAASDSLNTPGPIIVDCPGKDVIITPLGTGSALPSKHRNVSATLIQIPNWGNVLLDCGEGTWGQLARHFGPDTPDVLRGLKCVFISHIHGDHHMGIAKLLTRRRALRPVPSEPLFLISAWNSLQYLNEFNEIEDIGMQHRDCVRTIDARDILWDTSLDSKRASNDAIRMLKDSLGLESITTVEVEHRTLAHGINLRHKDGWSVVYSGDTMPCDDLVRAGMDATVLIHEATMADDQADMAKAKGHSTAGQAVDIGRRMNAKNILLTHFSQRYPKMPDLQPESATVSEAFEPSDSDVGPPAHVAVAFDCASLRIGSLWKMEKYMDAIGQTFDRQAGEEGGDDDADVPSEITEAGRTSPTKGKKSKEKRKAPVA